MRSSSYQHWGIGKVYLSLSTEYAPEMYALWCHRTGSRCFGHVDVSMSRVWFKLDVCCKRVGSTLIFLLCEEWLIRQEIHYRNSPVVVFDALAFCQSHQLVELWLLRQGITIVLGLMKGHDMFWCWRFEPGADICKQQPWTSHGSIRDSKMRDIMLQTDTDTTRTNQRSIAISFATISLLARKWVYPNPNPCLTAQYQRLKTCTEALKVNTCPLWHVFIMIFAACQ